MSRRKCYKRQELTRSDLKSSIRKKKKLAIALQINANLQKWQPEEVRFHHCNSRFQHQKISWERELYLLSISGKKAARCLTNGLLVCSRNHKYTMYGTNYQRSKQLNFMKPLESNLESSFFSNRKEDSEQKMGSLMQLQGSFRGFHFNINLMRIYYFGI